MNVRDLKVQMEGEDAAERRAELDDHLGQASSTKPPVRFSGLLFLAGTRTQLFEGTFPTTFSTFLPISFAFGQTQRYLDDADVSVPLAVLEREHVPLFEYVSKQALHYYAAASEIFI